MLDISTMKPSGGLDVLNDQVGHNQIEAIVGEWPIFSIADDAVLKKSTAINAGGRSGGR